MPIPNDIKSKANELIRAELGIRIKEINEQNYTMRFVFSTSSLDRHGERVIQEGWNFSEFLKNPVVLFAHDYHEMVIGKVTEIGIVGGQGECVIQFAAEENPKAMILWKLYKGGYMRALSAGFRNDKSEYDEGSGEMNLLENTLYEISCVPVPANAEALAKQKGINTDILKGLRKIKVWDDKENEIRYRIRDPKKFQEDSFRTITIQKKKPRVRGIIGKLKGEDNTTLQSLRFPKEDGWDLSKAKEWVKEHPDIKKALIIEARESGEADEMKELVEGLSNKIKKLSADINANKGKVETPAPQGGKMSVRAINKAMRLLMKRKKEIKS